MTFICAFSESTIQIFEVFLIFESVFPQSSEYTDRKIKEIHDATVENEVWETFSRIGLLRSYGNLQSYWTTTKLRKITVVLDYYEAVETYSRISVLE